MYIELNDTIEKVSNILEFSFMKITCPSAIFPFAVISAVTYILSDSDAKGDALRLPFPMMYVKRKLLIVVSLVGAFNR